jgi:type I restriction enzyme S subunit
MHKQEKQENIFQLNKSNWIQTKLGELADDISIRVDKPANSEYDKFVGLDNFISGDIFIKSWSSTKNLTSSAKAFKSGDILFARRNAYLRRASLVNFDGCCSGDAFVIREKLDKVVPGFLAFLMNSNSLWDYANSNAAGTMSKRVKWRDLAEYEFLLPPKDEQVRISHLVTTMYDLIEKQEKLLELNYILLNSFVEDVIHGRYLNSESLKIVDIGTIPESWQVVKMEEVLTINDGAHFTPTYVESGIPFLRVTDIQSTTIDLNNVKFIPKEEHIELCKRCKPEVGDILYSKNGTIGISKIINWDWEFSIFVSLALFKIKNKEILDIDYLKLILDSTHIKKEIYRKAKHGTITNLHLEEIRVFRLPLPNIEKQKEIALYVGKINNLIFDCKNKLTSTQLLQKSIINQIF